MVVGQADRPRGLSGTHSPSLSIYLISRSRSIFSYNHAVHVIRLRIHLLQKKLQEAELRARSSSLYLCPGYNSKTCNGRYNESEAQQIVDPETGLFLCRECIRTYVNHPSPPDKKAVASLHRFQSRRRRRRRRRGQGVERRERRRRRAGDHRN